MAHSHHCATPNTILFEVRKNSKIRIRYNVGKSGVVEVVGPVGIQQFDIAITDHQNLNIPYCISAAGIPYFPTRYESTKGDVWYHSLKSPVCKIRVVDERDYFAKRLKVMRVRITTQMLADYDKSTKQRPRQPSEEEVMGESATSHARNLIEKKLLVVPSGSAVRWRWCHLVPYTMLPSNRAQAPNNIIAGTAAFMSQIANIESAVKRFICQTKRQVTLEVTATLCPNSHLGTIIRYIILEPRSKTQLTEYVDALTEVYPIKADSEIMYAKLMTAFEERQSIKKSD